MLEIAKEMPTERTVLAVSLCFFDEKFEKRGEDDFDQSHQCLWFLFVFGIPVRDQAEGCLEEEFADPVGLGQTCQ